MGVEVPGGPGLTRPSAGLKDGTNKPYSYSTEVLASECSNFRGATVRANEQTACSYSGAGKVRTRPCGTSYERTVLRRCSRSHILVLVLLLKYPSAHLISKTPSSTSTSLALSPSSSSLKQRAVRCFRPFFPSQKVEKQINSRIGDRKESFSLGISHAQFVCAPRFGLLALRPGKL